MVGSVYVTVRALSGTFVVNGQGSTVKLHGAFWAADHTGFFHIGKDCHVARAIALERCDAVQ